MSKGSEVLCTLRSENRDRGALDDSDFIGAECHLKIYHLSEGQAVSDGEQCERIVRIITFNKNCGAFVSEDATRGQYTECKAALGTARPCEARAEVIFC